MDTYYHFCSELINDTVDVLAGVSMTVK